MSTQHIRYEASLSYPTIASSNLDETQQDAFDCIEGEWFHVLSRMFGQCQGTNDAGNYVFKKYVEKDPFDHILQVAVVEVTYRSE